MSENLRDAAEQIVENSDYDRTKNAIVNDIRRLAFKFGPENIPDLDCEQHAKFLGDFPPEIVREIAEVLMEEE